MGRHAAAVFQCCGLIFEAKSEASIRGIVNERTISIRLFDWREFKIGDET
jgi:hypothetical protein